jgi:hypothetical protein
MIKEFKGSSKIYSQSISNPMKKCTNKLNGNVQNEEVQRTENHEEILNVHGHHGNANQNHVKIPPHSCMKVYLQKHTTNVGGYVVKMEFS